MNLKLEVGKKYVDSQGGVARIIAGDKDDGAYCFVGLLRDKGAAKEDVTSYTETGVGKWACDLVEEYDEYEEWKTLPVDSKILVGSNRRYFASFDTSMCTVRYYKNGETQWSSGGKDVWEDVKICTIVKD